jgi:hypothetical protein
MSEIFSGIVTAVALIILYRLLSKYFTARLMASATLVAIAFIYVGFSLKDNLVSFFVLEVAVSLFFGYCWLYTKWASNSLRNYPSWRVGYISS